MTGRTGRAPTLDEVAERAGVSRSAASRVINNANHVSPATRRAVERAVRDLGYVPNVTAQALARQKVGAVVLAASHDNAELFGDPFFGQVIVGVTSALENTDLDLKLLLCHSERGHDRVRRMLRRPRADGVMVMALRGDDPLQRMVEESGLPAVYGGRPLHGQPSWYVDVDNRSGGRSAAEHAVRLGRRRVASIAGPTDSHAAVARQDGVADALSAAHLDAELVERADFTRDGGARATERLLAREPGLDAVVVASDNMAAGALQVLQRHGRRVPEDVVVVGFDDLPIAQMTQPALTTVQQPIRALGYEMARLLLAVVGGEEASPLLLPTRLVVRDSAPSAAAASTV
ncbi:LacI family DNA-binding transcriptional regulator [Cellulomonas sp. B6]|jgi:DNA-binding LacI/PurR family transcriptional regulator|uniref:LacI family DNA-binding transcriptional regulator n=1 Tax=Cellulomonas sp. B6 TaxID=1295626 RepID=UPI00073C69E3|nr:LacI family DNA-binding transcriptional regulator [Cellulomonas sp. B6]KSW28958.1 transcriptional regulator [Cellulomonas sp. B6]